MEFSKDHLFFCYDLSLKNKLKAKGIRFICTAITNDHKRFWLYFRNEEVNKTIKQHVGM